MLAVGIFLSDFQSTVNGILEFLFSAIGVQFSMELFFCCSTVCIYTLLFCRACLEIAGNGNNPVGITW